MATKKKDESTLLGVSENTARNLANYQAGYQEGERVQSAYNEYNQLKQNAPQAYVSPYQAQLDEIYSKITNRTPFKYNLNGDMLYQNAKEQYQQLGKQAMVDTIGQATQLTGGYGNSYAQNAGNQAYQQYLLKLNEQIPEYYKLAMDRYNMEGDQLNQAYALARDREDTEYGRYRDTVSDYNNNLQMAYNIYGKERDNDYNQYADALNYWQNQAGAENKDYWTGQNFDYQKQQDALAQANWERKQAFQEQKYRDDLAYKYASLAQSRALAEAKQKAAEEEAKRKADEEAKKKAEEEAIANNKLLLSSRYARSNGSGTTSNGLGVALNAYDSILANSSDNSAVKSLSDTIASKQNSKAPYAESGERKMDLGSTTGTPAQVASTFISNATKLRNSYASDTEFKQALNDTLRYYYDNNYIDETTAALVLKKFGLN